MKEDCAMRASKRASDGLQHCNRNLALEIGALFLALLGLMCLVIGIYDVLAWIVQIPGVTLSPLVKIAVISFDFVSAILIGIVCLALRAAAR
jgi:hypothetical protein